MGSILMGVDIGQQQAASGLCVVETERREGEKRTEAHFLVRYLERLPAGAPYPEIGKWVGQVVERVSERKEGTPILWINITGLGEPIFEIIRNEIPCGCISVVFNYGDEKVQETYSRVRLGKNYLVSRLQSLLQTNRLHLPNQEPMRQLAQELWDYQLKVEEVDPDRMGAFRVGSQDELVNALGMAVLEEPAEPLDAESMTIGKRTFYPGFMTGDRHPRRRFGRG